MTLSAYEWGKAHNSCQPALEQRKALGPDATQGDWWKICDRGDWLLWQLDKIELDLPTKKALSKAVEKIVTRAVTNHALKCGIKEVEKWARSWLSGKDRYATTAEAAWAAEAARAARAAWAAWAERAAEAAWEAELKLQAQDIHSEIPEWPG